MPNPSPTRTIIFAGQASVVPADVTCLNWPIAQGVRSAWLLMGVALAVIAALAWWAERWEPAVVVAVACAVSLWRVYLPVRWEFNFAGVTQNLFGWRRRIPWIAIHKFTLAPDGVWLFADAEASPVRGVFIYFAGEGPAISACLQYYLGTWTSAADRSTEVFVSPDHK